MFEKLLAIGGALIDGEAEAARAKARGSAVPGSAVQVPGSPVSYASSANAGRSIYFRESRDDDDDADRGDRDKKGSSYYEYDDRFRSFRSMSSACYTEGGTASTGDTHDSHDSWPTGHTGDSSASSVESIDGAADGKSRDDAGNAVRRIDDEEPDSAGRAIREGGDGGPSGRDVALEQNPTFLSEYGCEVELAGGSGDREEHNFLQPQCCGEAVELLPEPERADRMAFEPARDGRESSADAAFRGYPPRGGGGVSECSSSDNTRITRITGTAKAGDDAGNTDASKDTASANNTSRAANERGRGAAGAAPSRPRGTAGADADPGRAASPPPPPSPAGGADRKGRSSPFPLPRRARGFFGRKKPPGVPGGILRRPKRGGAGPGNRPNIPRAPGAGADATRAYIASRKMNNFSTRRAGAAVIAATFSAASPLQLEGAKEDDEDEPSVLSRQSSASYTARTNDDTYMTNDNTTNNTGAAMSGITGLTNDWTAMTGASACENASAWENATATGVTGTGVDGRNIIEKAADATYVIAKHCCADTVVNLAGDDFSYPTNDVIDEGVKKDAGNDAMENAALDLDCLYGIISVGSDAVEPCGQGIISVGSEADPEPNFGHSPDETAAAGGRTAAERTPSGPDDDGGEGAGDAAASRRARPAKSPRTPKSLKPPKRLRFRLPSFKKRKNVVLNEDTMADILNEIEGMWSVSSSGSSVASEASGNGSDDFVLPPYFSDMIANAIAEEAVLSCLEEEKQEIEMTTSQYWW